MSKGLERRDFLKVLGVSGAGAGLGGCGPGEVERLLPYVVGPEEITPGVATWYTTVCAGCSAGCGMWVRTREGRAVKIEGNPNHPVSEGALCSRGHATLQHLYNPDRYTAPMVREGDRIRPGTWDEAERLVAARLRGAANPLVITGHLGPSMSALVDEFVAAVGGTRVSFDPLQDEPLREAARMAYGVDGVPVYDIESARLLLSFGNDFVETGPAPVAHGRGLARMSTVGEGGTKGRFVYLGARLSVTGMNADEWIPIRSGSEAAVALGMASALAGGGAGAGPYQSLVSSYSVESAAAAAGVSPEAIQALAERFVSEGPSLALGPGTGAHHRNATAANLAVMVLNHVAGNVGRTVRYVDAAASGGGAAAGTGAAGGGGAAGGPGAGGGQSGGGGGSYAALEQAIAAMAADQVGAVLVLGANPAYSLPPASGFSEAFERVPFKVSFATWPDETAAAADLIVPDRHFLEAWGDAVSPSGVVSIQQPVMQALPMFDAKQAGDVLLAVTSHLGAGPSATTFYEYLRARHQASMGAGDFEAAWREALRTGVASTGAEGAGATELQAPDTPLTFDAPAVDGEGDLTLLVHPSPRFGAGEFANSPWMQELPDPVSKITWHSWLEMNPAAAELRGIRNGDMVRVSSPHGSLEVPVWLYPGIREDAVALAMGSGHTAMGRYADGNGVNAVTLLPAAAEQPSGALVTVATTVTVEPTGARRRLASIEGSDQQYDRPLAMAVALDQLGHEAEEADAHDERRELQAIGGFAPVPAAEGEPTVFPLPGTEYGPYAGAHEGPRWGMAIDLDKCTGCSACVTACQAENNVPWVGEQQILMGRDMNWIRIERYYEHVDATEAGDLDVRFLPMLCQHCGNAPCEPVCPVFATYHTPDGVNAQIYNRCVGTRYCANNCPYKVRVFNFYRYTDAVPEPLNWQWNPDVTVRDNGVMEKCSFCMQRIRDAQNRAALEDGRQVRDGEIVPACQQTCPAEAIVFGDLRDPDTRVSQVLADERTYRALDELINTQPAVNYLRKVTFHEVSSGAH